ncbi:MAG: hypothetical protein ABIK80_07500 [candidate division WOR-3 bacterium]
MKYGNKITEIENTFYNFEIFKSIAKDYNMLLDKEKLKDISVDFKYYCNETIEELSSKFNLSYQDAKKIAVFWGYLRVIVLVLKEKFKKPIINYTDETFLDKIESDVFRPIEDIECCEKYFKEGKLEYSSPEKPSYANIKDPLKDLFEYSDFPEMFFYYPIPLSLFLKIFKHLQPYKYYLKKTGLAKKLEEGHPLFNKAFPNEYYIWPMLALYFMLYFYPSIIQWNKNYNLWIEQLRRVKRISYNGVNKFIKRRITKKIVPNWYFCFYPPTGKRIKILNYLKSPVETYPDKETLIKELYEENMTFEKIQEIGKTWDELLTLKDPILTPIGEAIKKSLPPTII